MVINWVMSGVFLYLAWEVFWKLRRKRREKKRRVI